MSILAELFENGKLLEVMMDFGEEVVRQARSNVRISQTKFGRKRKASTSGALQASLKFDVDVNTGALTFGSDLIYARTIEFGAHGKESSPKGESKWMTPARKPPAEAILKWMDMKKIRLREKTASGGSKFAKETPSKRKSVAYAIAKSIEKKGISPLEYFQDAYKETLPDFMPQILDAINEGIQLHILNQSRTLKTMKQ
jgi:hypothetical protein